MFAGLNIGYLLTNLSVFIFCKTRLKLLDLNQEILSLQHVSDLHEYTFYTATINKVKFASLFSDTQFSTCNWILMIFFGWEILEKFSNLNLEKTSVDTYCCEPLNDLFFQNCSKNISLIYIWTICVAWSSKTKQINRLRSYNNK